MEAWAIAIAGTALAAVLGWIATELGGGFEGRALRRAAAWAQAARDLDVATPDGAAAERAGREIVREALRRRGTRWRLVGWRAAAVCAALVAVLSAVGGVLEQEDAALRTTAVFNAVAYTYATWGAHQRARTVARRRSAQAPREPSRLIVPDERSPASDA